MTRPAIALALFFLLAGLAAWAIPAAQSQPLMPNKPAPEIGGAPASDWINSPPLTLAGLRGRAVLVEFWTYG